MGVKKRKYKTKEGSQQSKYWSYEFFIDNERFQDTLDSVTKLPEAYEFPKGKNLENLTKAQAEEICRQLKEQEKAYLTGGNVKGITFDEAAAAFYTDYLSKLNKRREKAPHKNIKDSYNGIIARLAEEFGEFLLSEIDKVKIAAFRAKRRQSGVSDKTIRNDILCLSSIFTFAADDGLYEEDDVPNFRAITKKLKKSLQRTRYASPQEYDMLIEQYDTLAAPYNTRTRRRMVMFDVESGLRKEELLSLLEIDLFFDQNKFWVRETKNGQDRMMPLSTIGRRLLQEQLQDKINNNIMSDYVFSKTDGERFSDIGKGFRSDCKRAKIKDLTFHDLRRTFGSWRLQGIRCKRMRIEEVSALLGHSDIAITQKAYAFLDKEKIKLA